MEYGCWKMAGKTVGGGRQGQVELVTDASGKESGEFALKKLKDDRRIQRFKQEIDAVARLNHPNIIRIVDHRVDQKPYYYVMEYCEGGSLEKIGGRAFRADISKAVEILDPICAALAVAHKAGIMHRDVKPANILVQADGTPVIADFDICRADESESVTLHEEAMGPINSITSLPRWSREGAIWETLRKRRTYKRLRRFYTGCSLAAPYLAVRIIGLHRSRDCSVSGAGSMCTWCWIRWSSRNLPADSVSTSFAANYKRYGI